MKILLGIGLSLGIIFPILTSAQTQNNQFLQVQGLGLAPFLIETIVTPGKAQLQKITLTNMTDAPLPIEISINDFIPSQKGDGQASFLPPDQISDPKFSLSKWIEITSQPSFNIPARGQTEVEFKITAPVDAEPGTHYGGLLFSYRPPSSKDSVKVTQKVGVIVLAQFGQANELGVVTDFLAEPNLNYSQVQFLLSFYNQGNVHLKPKGEIHIENMFGHEVASLPVNRDANIILPESQRLFENSWVAGWRLGRYTATAILFYGNPKLEVRSTVSFWIIPWQRILLVIIVLAIIIFVIFLLIKRYNRWLITRHKV